MKRRGFLRLIGGLGLLALSPIKAPTKPVWTGVEILTGPASWLADVGATAGPLTLADMQRMKELINTGRSYPNYIPLSREKYDQLRSKLESWYFA